MPTDLQLKNVHVFPSEESFETNASSVAESDLALVPFSLDMSSILGGVRDTFFPVGSIYMDATGKIDPNMQFGGTWVKIQNSFLYGSGSKSVGATGGEEYHTLTTSEMPSHSHDIGAVRSRGAFTATDQANSVEGDFSVSATGQLSKSGNHYSGQRLEFQFYTTSSGSVSSVGDGDSHNNMPPYLTVNIWKRTL